MTVKQYLRRAQADAEDTKALAYQLFLLTGGAPRLHDLAARAERIAGRLTTGLEEVIAQVRGGDDGSKQLRLLHT